jgi:4'-phosphopantetheinyl transferase
MPQPQAVASESTLRSHWVTRTRAEVPPGTAWLGDAERAILSRLRFPKRRADWRVGRWAAKQVVAHCLRERGIRPVLSDIQILPAPDGAPEARVAGLDLILSVSISHSGDTGFAAACPAAVPLGCDVERVEKRSPRFVNDYFTPREALLVDRAPEASRPFLASLIWSAKESVLKARRVGLRADTRTVEVRLAGDRFGGRCGLLSMRCVEPVETLRGCWWVADGFVYTIASSEALCEHAAAGEGPEEGVGAEGPGLILKVTR